MANNKLILRTLVSPWITPVSDFTRNGVLSFDDLDNNFIYLRGELIHSIETSGNTITLKKINGNDLSFISEDTFVTGGTYNPSTFALNFTGNDGFNPFNVDVSSLLDTYISGGTYNPSNGCVSFTSTSGYTFDVCGFVTGITNTFTTGGTYDNSTSLITFTKNDNTTYGVDLSSLPVTDDVTIGVNGSNEIELKEVVGAPTGGTRTFDGYITITSGLTLNNLGTGTSINNLGIDSNGNIVVGTSGSTGTVGGSGTVNYVSRWTPSGDTLGDSLIQDNGTSLSIGNPPNNVSILDIDTSLQGVFVTTTKVNTASNQSAYGLLGISSGNNSLGENIGVAGFANANTNRAIGVLGNAINNVGNTNIGGYFTAASGVNNYSLQLRDGTEGTGKFLKSVTANGEANWATITASDVSGVVGGSGLANTFGIWSNSNTISYDTGMTRTYTSGPGYYSPYLRIVGNDSTGSDSSVLLGNGSLSLQRDSYSQVNLTTYSSSNQFPIVSLNRFMGTMSSPIDVASGNILGRLRWSSGSGEGANIDVFTTETHSTGQAGSYLKISTTPNGSTTPLERMRIDQNGNVGIGVNPFSANKFYVRGDSGNNNGIFSYIDSGNPSGGATGVLGRASILSATGTSGNVGLVGQGYNSVVLNIGVKGQGSGQSASPSNFSYGGYFLGSNATECYGLYALAGGNNISTNCYGGYFRADSSKVGASNYALWLQDGTQGNGKFLKSVTADGKANWSNITSSDITGLPSSYWTSQTGALVDTNTTIAHTTLNTNTDSIIGGGRNNKLDNSDHAVIMGGYNNNILSGDTSLIIGGTLNDIQARSGSILSEAGILGGTNNNIVDTTSDSDRSFIIGGVNNNVNDSTNSIIIGSALSNISNASQSGFILGSNADVISSTQSGVIGGTGNVINNADRTVIIGGQGITGTTNDTVYVPNLEVKNDLVVEGSNTLNTINRQTYTFTTTGATPYVVGISAGVIRYGRYIKAIVIGNSTGNGSLGGEFVKFYDFDALGAGSTQLSSTGTLAENITTGTPTFSISDIAEFTATGVAATTIDWKVIIEYSDIS